ncbi:zinc ribbon domain-containing protein [Labilibacter sediminis]|nr:zinc ribbon domain-containing protein [Labilibacter sediminis]
MEYCKNCEVELDDDMVFCPLCGLRAGAEPISVNIPKEKHPDFRDKTLNEIENLSLIQKLKLIWKISGIILISGIIITLAINFIISHNINWAKYNLIASITTFANISFVIFFRKKPLILSICSLTSLILMFLMIDYFNGDSNWGIKLGIPIVISVYVLSLVILVLIRISNQIGFNILAVIFIAIASLLLCIEIFVSLYSHHIIILKWSLIAGASLMPISGLLFFVHYKLKMGIELKRFFHI